ncbi:hypothetical protein F2P81_020896 [Scophthalmus maximus]|uniref:Uncharacterized protein n=1 Tax=Scophthalmus maximus TaxID=52904 RepID=A0A6A4S0V8_SCOMX|nr:hypothetical protein F2P81_020896 [Scophthalmus maximus]
MFLLDESSHKSQFHNNVTLQDLKSELLIQTNLGVTMLLRVILSQEDIRRVTIDNMPETVDGLHLMLKNKLGLE